MPKVIKVPKYEVPQPEQFVHKPIKENIKGKFLEARKERIFRVKYNINKTHAPKLVAPEYEMVSKVISCPGVTGTIPKPKRRLPRTFRVEG